MPAYTVYLEQLQVLLASWAGQYAVHVPASAGNGFYDFTKWKKGVEIAWEYDVAVNPLKRFLLPPREDLIRFDARAATAEPVFEAPAQLLFGVHPYDLKAIVQLDQLMEAGSPDQNYLRRRENTVVFALEPARVARDAFWGSVGAHRIDIGYDLYWTKISPAAFHVRVGSPRGEDLLMAGGALPKSSPSEREAARRARERITREARKDGLSFPWQQVPQVLAKSWDSPLWMEKAQSCFACGSCNAVCPTCYCFDVREEIDESLGAGKRWREWDACMLSSFALVAGGHNFRAQARDRYRHRYFRKGKYIFDLLGELGCVGCGRCVSACTARIANPKAVFNALREETR
jgi:ferredoxin